MNILDLWKKTFFSSRKGFLLFLAIVVLALPITIVLRGQTPLKTTPRNQEQNVILKVQESSCIAGECDPNTQTKTCFKDSNSGKDEVWSCQAASGSTLGGCWTLADNCQAKGQTCSSTSNACVNQTGITTGIENNSASGKSFRVRIKTSQGTYIPSSNGSSVFYVDAGKMGMPQEAIFSVDASQGPFIVEHETTSDNVWSSNNTSPQNFQVSEGVIYNVIISYTEGLSAPTLLLPANGSNVNSCTNGATAVGYSWRPVSGAAGYKVYVNGDGNQGDPFGGYPLVVSGGNNTSTTQSGLLPSWPYSWGVKAYDQYGIEGPGSAVWNFKTAACGGAGKNISIGFTSPADKATVHGSTLIQTSAIVVGAVNNIQLFVDGNNARTCFDTSCVYNWDTTKVANGNHTLKATVSDIYSNTASKEITVNVQNVAGGGGQPTATTVPGQPTATTNPNQPTATSVPGGQPTATKVPSATLTSTPPAATSTISPNETRVGIELLLPGIGSNAALGGNSNPVVSGHTVELQISNSQNQKVKEAEGNVTYDTQSFSFKGTVSLGSTLDSGAYLIKARLNNTLWKNLGLVNIVTGQTSQASQTKLISGDLDQNNELNLFDYNTMLACYGAGQCDKKTQSDLNIDGKVDEQDLNILYAGFAKRVGD